MDLGFAGKVVAVTGASKGIGFACAEAFAREGAKVALVSRSAANLEAALRSPQRRSASSDHVCAPISSAPRKPSASGRRNRARAGSCRHPRQFGRRRAPLRAGRSRRRRVARGNGCEVLQLHAPDRRRCCRAWRARPREPSSTSSVPAARSQAPCICRGRCQCRADARHCRPRGRFRAEGHPHQRHQPRVDAHRARAGRLCRWRRR